MKNNFLGLVFSLTSIVHAQNYSMQRVTDICPGAWTGVRGICSYNGPIYFSGKSPNNGIGLWKSDGTIGGTYFVKETGSNFNSPANYLTEGPVTSSGIFFFGAYSDSEMGFVLWRSDGTAGGTYSLSGPEHPQNIIELNGFVVFSAYTDDKGTELWRSDGTQQGTYLVKDINPGPNTSIPSFLPYSGLLNNRVFFSATDGVHGNEAWVSDGTSTGTYMIKDLCVGSCDGYFLNPIVFNNAIYFWGGGGIYRTNGTPNDPIKILNTGWQEPAVMNNMIYFSANSNGSNLGYELYSAAMTNSVITLIKDIFPGSSSSYPTFLTAIDGKLYFNANDGVNGGEIWISDGTTGGTKMLKAISSYTYSTIHTSSFRPANGKVYFTGVNIDVTGTEIWETDGTEAGTKIYDLWPGSLGNVVNFRDAQNELYLTGNDGQSGDELWKIGGPVTGVMENSKYESGLNLYPNPTSGKFGVKCADKQANQVFNANGELTITIESEDFPKEIDLSTKPSGIYFVKVGVATTKVCKE
jgi:ELWxxDGT repeat protein